jgi:hypothetical protein
MIKAFNAVVVSLVLCGFLFSAFAQVNITGTVRDQNKNPVGGVSVILKGKQLMVSTDAAGRYSFTGSEVRHKVGERWITEGAPFIENGLLNFTVPANNCKVDIQLFDLQGRWVGSVAKSELVRGDYRINPYSANRSSQTYFLRVTIGNHATTLRMPACGGQTGIVAPVINRMPDANATAGKLLVVNDTIRVKKAGYSLEVKAIDAYTGVYDFVVTDTAWFWGDIAKIPKATQVLTYVFLNRTNGKYTDDQVFWTFNNTTKTIAQQSTYDMPANSSGRVTFHLGTSNSQYWDFMEHTIQGTMWYGNTTRVDGWRLPLAIRLHCADGYDAMLGDLYRVFTANRDSVFADFKRSVPTEFVHCADKGYPYAIVAPGKGDGGFGPGQQYASYMTAYLAQIGQAGPTTEQVFSCSGNPFGSNAQLAGAVNRHVAHLPQAQWNTPALYYQAAPANFYAKYWHDQAFDWKCYGFAYDDAANQAAYTQHNNPQYLIIAVGY